MPISNTNPQPKDVVILQRDDTNSQYIETHISASDVILHIDSAGHINADKSSSFYTLYPPPGKSENATSASWSSQSFTAESSSWTSHSFAAESASWTSHSFTAESSSWASHSFTAESASWTSHSISASYAETSSLTPFNGNRTIKRSPYTDINVGGDDVVEFLNNFFFPFIPSTVNMSSFANNGLYEMGTVVSVPVISIITANDETIFTSGEVKRDGVTWNVAPTIPPLSFTFTDSNVSSNHTYTTYIQVGNNGSPATIISPSRTVSFIYPYLWGMSTTPGLNGNQLYTTFTRQIQSQGNKSVSLIGNVTYIYFCYPSSYPDLQHIVDPNLFQIISSFEYSASVPVTSSGLTNDWQTTYKVYRSKLLSDPNGTFQFNYN